MDIVVNYRWPSGDVLWSLDADPPDLNLVPYGWTMNDENKLAPMSISPNVSLAPESVLRMIKCGCLTCATELCRCSVANISCSEFFAGRATRD